MCKNLSSKYSIASLTSLGYKRPICAVSKWPNITRTCTQSHGSSLRYLKVKLLTTWPLDGYADGNTLPSDNDLLNDNELRNDNDVSGASKFSSQIQSHKPIKVRRESFIKDCKVVV